MRKRHLYDIYKQKGSKSGPEAIKLFSCSIQFSMKFILLINLKLLTTAKSCLLNITEHENFSADYWHFHIY